MSRREALRMWLARIGLALAVALAASGCAHFSGSRNQGDADVRAAIEAANAEFAAALVRGDARAMAAVFAQDAAYIPATRPGVVTGREAIEAHHAKALEGRRYLDASLTTIDVGSSGDLAWETGTSRVTIQQANGAPVTLTGRYLAVWQRGEDGRWRIRADLPVTDPVRGPELPPAASSKRVE